MAGVQGVPIALSKRKLWTFRLISLVVFPLAVLVVLELGLRLGGYGYETRAVVPRKVGGVRCLVSNDSFGRLFFPAKLAREFDPFTIPVDKEKNHCRIIVLGASAVQGVPDGAYCFSRMLKVLLEETYPSVDFEVFNAGMTAINSHCVVQIAKDLRGCKADVFVVYLGNNEVVGPYGAGTVFSPIHRKLSFIRAGIWARRYRVGQLMSSIASRKKDAEFDKWGGMQMYLEQEVSADDPQLEIVYRHFRTNLEDICSVAHRAGAKILLSTVGSNLRNCAPFVSVHGKSLSVEEKDKWEAVYQEGVTLEEEGNVKGAIEKYLLCERIDNGFADLYFRLGRIYDSTAEQDKAGRSYEKARELDALRFRADNRINSIIREVAAQKDGNVYFADGAAALAEKSEDGICGRDLFYEHVHMTFEGNAVVAGALMRGLEEALPEWVLSKKTEHGGVDLKELKNRLAFTPLDNFISKEVMLHVYLKKPPFTNQLFHADQIPQLEKELQGLSRAITREAVEQSALVYRNAIGHWPKDWWLRWKYAELLAERLGDIKAAIEQCQQVLELVPQYRKGHVQFGSLLQKAGRIDDAERHYLEALDLKNDDPAALYSLGLASSIENQPEEAIKWYRRTLAVDRRHQGAIVNLGEMLNQVGRADQAIEVYREALTFLPENVNIYYNLGILCYTQGHKQESLQYMRKARELDPGSRDIREVLRAMERK